MFLEQFKYTLIKDRGEKMVTNFGIEEAKRASKFAINDEQRRTVLAVAHMFNIPIVIKKQVAKVVAKRELAYKKKQAKIRNFDVKVIKLENEAKVDGAKIAEVLEVGDNWNI